MKVLFLTDSLSDLDGVGRYAVRLIAKLEEHSPSDDPLEVEVLLARKHRPTSADVPAHWKVSVALPPDYFYYMSRLRFWIWYALGTWGAYRAARSADIVHAIKDYPHNAVALSAARLAGKPCVATAHGTYTIQPLVSARHAARARRTYAGFARMISVSHYTRRWLLKLCEESGTKLAPVEVIPNAVAAEAYVAPREIGARPWHGHPFTLGIGEVKERKGHHLALEAWCRVAVSHPELQHYIVGKRSADEYEQRLLAMVREAGLEERVHFLGNITEDEKIDLLQRALIFLHTPITAADGGFEGFGIVYLEAAAAGTPAIGTLDSGAEDAIVDGETGRLVEQQAHAVQAALRELLEDPVLRERRGAAGRAHARSCSWDENARRVLAVYGEVRP
ncbi:MAG: phosphatidylinositol alpha-1,6-mannosyltransferase [Chlamydiales bacterium]|jgi:phosphatidylinositol alpha-1,6-mannosyltransferase